MFKLADYIRMLKKDGVKFTSIINGNAHSAASVIAVVANVRKMTDHSCAMIHEIKAGPGIQMSSHLDAYSSYINKRQKKLLRLYQVYSKSDVETINKLMSVETYFDAEEYLKHGFIDEIITGEDPVE